MGQRLIWMPWLFLCSRTDLIPNSGLDSCSILYIFLSYFVDILTILENKWQCGFSSFFIVF
jgi:hypothetical protein